MARLGYVGHAYQQGSSFIMEKFLCAQWLPRTKERTQNILQNVINIITIGLVLWPTNLWATDISPFATTNYSPLTQVFGLPPIPDVNDFKIKAGKWSARVDYSSHFAASITNSELAFMDGESNRSTITYAAKPSGRFQWRVDIPYISYRGGTMDGFVDEWHKFFNLPKGSRDKRKKDQLLYFYSRDKVILLNIQQPHSGVGDILLTGQWYVKDFGGRRSGDYSLFTSLKFPTGDKEAFLGSGSVDISVGMAGNEQWVVSGYKGRVFLSSGLMRVGTAEYLSEIQNKLVLFGGVGVGMSLSHNLAVKAQLDGHSAFYSGTRIAEIGQEAAQLTLGFQLNLKSEWKVDAGLSEDLKVNASPDVTFHVATSYSF